MNSDVDKQMVDAEHQKCLDRLALLKGEVVLPPWEDKQNIISTSIIKLGPINVFEFVYKDICSDKVRYKIAWVRENPYIMKIDGIDNKFCHTEIACESQENYRPFNFHEGDARKKCFDAFCELWNLKF